MISSGAAVMRQYDGYYYCYEIDMVEKKKEHRVGIIIMRRRAGNRNNAQKHGHDVDDSSPNCRWCDPTRCSKLFGIHS